MSEKKPSPFCSRKYKTKIMFYWDIIVESAAESSDGPKHHWKGSEKKKAIEHKQKKEEEKSARKEEFLWQAIDIWVGVEWKESSKISFALFPRTLTTAKASEKAQNDHRLMLFHCGSPLHFTRKTEQFSVPWVRVERTELMMSCEAFLFQKAFCSFRSVLCCCCCFSDESLKLFFLCCFRLFTYFMMYFSTAPSLLYISPTDHRRAQKSVFAFVSPHALLFESHRSSKIRVHQFSLLP